MKREADPETVFVLAKRNYKVYANLGTSARSTKRFVAILDTGAGSSFINMKEIPQSMRKEIRPLKEAPNVRNASGKAVPIAGTIDLVTQIGTTSECVSFLVAEKLATSVILGCDFCDQHIDAIKPRLATVTMDDGSTVPIIRQPSKANTSTPLPDAQCFSTRKDKTSPKIKTTRRVKLTAATQTWVEVVTKRDGTILVDPHMPLYTNVMCIAGTGVANVKANLPFRILIANFGDNDVTLAPQQVVAKASGHPETLAESHLSHAEVFGLIPDDKDTKFRKRHANARDVDTINRHLADHREKHMGEDEKPVTADDINVDVPDDKVDEVRAMLRKHEKAWSGQLGEINATELRIDLKPDAIPFESPPYRAGPKTRELEKA